LFAGDKVGHGKARGKGKDPEGPDPKEPGILLSWGVDTVIFRLRFRK
jgi:hypothetical protein